MFRKSALLAALVALPLMGLSACDDATGPGQNASLTVQLTDAPSAAVDSAWVNVDQITLQGTEGGVNLLEGETGYIELTQLADSATTLVENEAVPQGSYGQLRFHVAGAALKTDGGSVYSFNGGAEAVGHTSDGELTCPSCGQTGIKVNMPEGGLQLETEAKILVLDFDVSESFGQQAGMSGMWVMHPTITSSTVQASGTIVGTVTPDSGVSFPSCNGESRSVEDFVPHALVPGTDSVVKSGNTSSDSSYAIQFLAPGDYDMSHADTVVLDPDSLFFTASPSQATATVESGMETTVDYSISEVICSSS